MKYNFFKSFENIIQFLFSAGESDKMNCDSNADNMPVQDSQSDAQSVHSNVDEINIFDQGIID